MQANDGLRMTRSEIITRTALGPQAIKAYRDPLERRNKEYPVRHECTSTRHHCPICAVDPGMSANLSKHTAVEMKYLERAAKDFEDTRSLVRDGRLFSSRREDLRRAMKGGQGLNGSDIASLYSKQEADLSRKEPMKQSIYEMTAKLPPHSISLSNPYGSTSLWKEGIPPPVKTEYRTSYMPPHHMLSMELNNRDTLTQEVERRSLQRSALHNTQQRQAARPTEREAYRPTQPLNSFVPDEDYGVVSHPSNEMRILDSLAPRYLPYPHSK